MKLSLLTTGVLPKQIHIDNFFGFIVILLIIFSKVFFLVQSLIIDAILIEMLIEWIITLSLKKISNFFKLIFIHLMFIN
jgi:hypothetical protein